MLRCLREGFEAQLGLIEGVAPPLLVRVGDSRVVALEALRLLGGYVGPDLVRAVSDEVGLHGGRRGILEEGLV